MTRTQALLALAVAMAVALVQASNADSTIPTIRNRQRVLQKGYEEEYPRSVSKGDNNKANSRSDVDIECFEESSARSGGKSKGRRYLGRGLKNSKVKGGGARSGQAVKCENGKKVPNREYPEFDFFGFSDGESARSEGVSGKKSNGGSNKSGVACSRSATSSGNSKGKISKRRTRGLKKGSSKSSGARSGDECIEGVSGDASAKGGKNKAKKAENLPSRDYPEFGFGESGDAPKGASTTVNKATAAPKGAAAPKGSVESAMAENSGDDQDAPYTTSAAMASVESVPSSSGRKVGFSIGMMGVIFMSLAALKVGMNRKRAASAKALYADMSDDEFDDETFVMPNESELLGPECSQSVFEEDHANQEPKSSSYILDDLEDEASMTTGGSSSFASSRARKGYY